MKLSTRCLTALGALLLAPGAALAEPPRPAAPPAAPSAGPAVPRAAAPAVALRPSDELSVKVLDHPELSSEVRVGYDGTVDVPFVGSLRAVGRSLPEIAADVKAALEKTQIRDPQVSVTVHALAPNSFFVIGKVNNQSKFTFARDERVHLLRALSEAGGFATESDQAQVQVISASGEARMVDARLSNAQTLARIFLENGTTIVVPELGRIYVTGQVNRAGGFPPPAGEPMTLTKVISLAGGFTRLARTGQVQVIYPAGAGGQEQTRTYDFDQIQGGRVPDPPIFPGCRIFVPERLF